MNNMQIEMIGTDALQAYEDNVKIHDKQQVDDLSNSIDELGFRVPILVNSDNVIIAGHGRLMAAKKLGMKEVPCIKFDDLTEEEEAKLRITDNSLNESEWDMDKFQSEIKKYNIKVSMPKAMKVAMPNVDIATPKPISPTDISSINSLGGGNKRTLHVCPDCGHEFE